LRDLEELLLVGCHKDALLAGEHFLSFVGCGLTLLALVDEQHAILEELPRSVEHVLN
jgi:hypothetical protein